MTDPYMHIGEKIDVDGYVICDYRVTPSIPMESAASAIATEQSTGTWTNLTTTTEKIVENYGAKVLDISDNLVKIAYPVEDFSIDIGGIPQILSVIAGNLFGLESLNKLRLEDVIFPKCIMDEYKGPKFGVEGLRKILDRPEKPLVGTIVKPKIGLSPKDTAKYIYEAGKGGLTNSKDDETLTNQKFCPIEDRTVLVAEVIDQLKSEGHKMVHAINISTNGDKIVELAEKVQSWGASQLMIDVITCGFAAVQAVAEDPSIKIPIHVHRTMHGALTRDPLHGISMLPITKLVRMCGGDALHIGTLGVGKMSGDVKGDMACLDTCLSKMNDYKTMMPVCSGGVYPGMIGKVIEKSGNTVQIQAGGGVAGHPGGVTKGAMAMCQAVEAAFQKIPVQEYAKTHEELKIALDKWGMK